MTIKTNIVASIAGLALLGTSAFAADIITKAPKKVEAAPASCFDLAVGGGIQSDYNFRGVSQSDKGPSAYAYIEPRCNITKDIQLYAGIWGWSTKLPTSPTGEFDLYGGIRPTFDKFAFDFGFIYYFYPNETQVFIDGLGNLTNTFTPTPFTVKDTDFWEVYGKLTWTVTDWLALSPYVYYSPNVLQSGANGDVRRRRGQVHHADGLVPDRLGWILLRRSRALLAGYVHGLRRALRSAELHHMERGPGLHLQDLHVRRALLRYRPHARQLRVADQRSERICDQLLEVVRRDCDRQVLLRPDGDDEPEISCAASKQTTKGRPRGAPFFVRLAPRFQNNRKTSATSPTRIAARKACWG